MGPDTPADGLIKYSKLLLSPTQKLRVKSRLRLHLAVQLHYQLRGQVQACRQHGKIGFLGGGIHIDGKP